MTQDAVFPREADLSLVAHYKDFLPKKICDAHLHMHLGTTIPNFRGSKGVFFREKGSPETYLADMSPLLPGVESVQLNMMPMLDPVMADRANGQRILANQYVLDLQAQAPQHTVSPFILPGDTEDELDALTALPGVRGLKCYCYGVGSMDVEALAIGDFLPESAWIVAQQKRLPIILHMMRPAALSDPDNFSYITQMTQKYPNAQLVLAHCGRAFAAWTVVEKIRQLEDQGNIWFDLAAICESGPMMACIMKNAGKRTMWGSDYPVCLHRGRPISVSTGTNWLIGDGFASLDRALVGAENLMALYQAALLLNLDQPQIDAIFYDNAAALFHL